MTPYEGFKLQLGEYIAMTERRFWSDKEYFLWFKDRFGFSVW